TGSTLTLNGGWQNNGTITETSSAVNLGGTFNTAGIGTLNTTSGTISVTGTLTNTNATFSTGPTGTNWYFGGGTIVGGNVSPVGTAQLTVPSGGSGALTGVILAGPMTVMDGATLTINNGLTFNNGSILLSEGQTPQGGGVGPATLLVAGTGTQTVG